MLKRSLRVIQRSPKGFFHELNVRPIRCLPCKHLIVTKKVNSPVNPLPNISCLDLNSRSYSKSRDKKKEKKGTLKFDENEVGEYLDVEKLLSDVKKPLEIFKEELMKQVSLRSSPGAIESIKFEFEGDTYTIQDLAEIGRKNPRLLVLDFSSFPTAVTPVMDALRNSELNVNAQQEGTRVFVPLPKVTKEHREVLSKKCKMYFIKCKDAIRDTQMRYVKSLGNIEKLPVDDKFRLTEQLTNLANKQIQVAETLMKDKLQEITKVDEG